MVRQLHSTMSEILNEHKRTYDKDSMRNLTDVYLKQIQESRDPNFNGKYQNHVDACKYIIILPNFIYMPY